MQEPVERRLGSELEWSSGSHRDKYDYCYDIPLIDSLRLLLKHKEIQKQV